jgi:hypothetical protein
MRRQNVGELILADALESRPVIADLRDGIERTGLVPPMLISALKRADIMHMWVAGPRFMRLARSNVISATSMRLRSTSGSARAISSLPDVLCLGSIRERRGFSGACVVGPSAGPERRAILPSRKFACEG